MKLMSTSEYTNTERNIPKTLHYCWFSGNTIPDEYKRYLETWKEKCPDYEIIQWNSDNFNVNENRFSREAYATKKWAFVTDYARLKILYEHGGIYLDSDVEVLKKFDNLLSNKFFMGFETDKTLATCVIGAEPHNKIIEELLKYYDSAKFLNEDGTLNQTTNVKIITKIINESYSKIDEKNKLKRIDNNAVLYPRDYFSGSINLTENTYCIHHFGESWKDDKDVTRGKKVHDIYKRKELKPITPHILNRIRHNIIVVIANYSLYGMIDTVKFLITRITKRIHF